MIRHQTFSKVSGLNREATAEEMRKQAEDYINQHLQPQQALMITERWSPNNRVALTLWFQWEGDLPTIVATE